MIVIAKIILMFLFCIIYPVFLEKTSVKSKKTHFYFSGFNVVYLLRQYAIRRRPDRMGKESGQGKLSLEPKERKT